MTQTPTHRETGTPAADTATPVRRLTATEMRAQAAAQLEELRRQADLAAPEDRGLVDELIELIEQLMSFLLEMELTSSIEGVDQPDRERLTAFDLHQRHQLNRESVRTGGRPLAVGWDTQQREATERPVHRDTEAPVRQDAEPGAVQRVLGRIEAAEARTGAVIPDDQVAETLTQHDGMDPDAAGRLAAQVNQVRHARHADRAEAGTPGERVRVTLAGSGRAGARDGGQGYILASNDAEITLHDTRTHHVSRIARSNIDRIDPDPPRRGVRRPDVEVTHHGTRYINGRPTGRDDAEIEL